MFKTVLLVLTIFIIFSGCIEDNNINQSTEPVQQEPANLSPATLPEENIPEIKVISVSSIYTRYNGEFESGYNLTESYYAVYDISIKNNGSDNLYLKLSELQVCDGNHTFNATFLEPERSESLEVLFKLESKNKIKDTTLLPGQNINGSVVFQVNSLYNESFLLMYQEIPVTSPSFKKSIEALRIAERFDYSRAFGIPPYTDSNGLDSAERSSFEPNLDSYPYIWPNWRNISVFEFFNRTDSERMLNSPPENIPQTHIVYAVEVIPERNITILPVKTRFSKNNLLVFDDAGEELINTSRIEGIAVLRSNGTYEFHPRWNVDIPQTNVSGATIVRFSFESYYGWPLASRLSFINQDVILDEELNIMVARYHCGNFIS